MTARHGFIDESVRADGWYRLTMVDVAARDLGSVTRALRSMVPKGRQRLHFSAEGESQRRQILNGMMLLPITALTVAAPYRRGRDEEPARQRCIEALVAELDPRSCCSFSTAAALTAIWATDVCFGVRC